MTEAFIVVSTAEEAVDRLAALHERATAALSQALKRYLKDRVEPSAEQAQALVRALHYPPQGIRGVGTAMARAAHWNGVGDYFQHADREVSLIVQIESVEGLAQLEAIAAVPGVDGVFIGPADLAASMGYLGQPGHPEVRAAVEQALTRIRAGGKAAGVFTADPALAAHYQALGASFLLVGVDTLLLRSAATSLAARFKQGRGEGSAAAY